MKQEIVKEQEVRVLQLQREKVAIVGCSGCKVETPYDDDSWEFWGVNNLYHHVDKQVLKNRAWKWFEIHPIEFTNGHWLRRWGKDFRGQPVDDYIKNITELPFPVLMQQAWKEIPNALQYPISEIMAIQEFRGYFTNTISYEIALAIYLGAKEIGIWGVDMAVASAVLQTNEYGFQRPSCEYFIGLAVGRGIKVTIPGTSDLLKTNFLYAYQEKDKNDYMKKLDLVDSQINNQINEAQRVKADLKVKMEEANNKIQQAIGANAALHEMKRIWSNQEVGNI